MAKFAVCCFIVGMVIFSCAQVKTAQQKEVLPSAIPALHILNDTTAAPVKISSLAIDITTAANIATTTFDIIFYNPNDRILEGEFDFPLADGQTIVRYALDIDGKLREGVVVEKEKGRIAFESTIRRKVDPGLLEKTKGNNFRTRIYPLPAKGTRHILIAVEQKLEQQQKNLIYQLPLFAQEPIDKFSVRATVIKNAEQPETTGTTLQGFDFTRQGKSWVADYEKNNFTANDRVSFIIPNSSTNEITAITENFNGQTYFYVNSRMEPAYKKKKRPGTIGILWDVSASGERRNIEKEKQLLKAYLSGDVKVSLIPFNIYLQDKEDFAISGGNCNALLQRISQLQYDGGTQLGAIDLTLYDFDEVLLFSDGLANFGKKEIVLSQVPVITINSSPSADFSYLKFIARQSHGKFIDLTKLEPAAAVEEITNLSLQVTGIQFNPAEVEGLVTQVSPVQSSGISFAGKLKAPSAEITINLGFGNETIATKKFTILKPASSEYNQVKRIWAAMQVDELDLQFEKNKEAITKLGKEFSIVTQNTSLIVLDRLEDYVEHEITPPEELQKEYFTLLKEKKEAEKNETESAMDEAVTAMNELKEWWNTDYSNKSKQLITKNYAPPIIVADQTVSAQMQVDRSTIMADSITERGGYARVNASFSVSDSSLVPYTTESVIVSGLQTYGWSKSESMDNIQEIAKPPAPSIELNEWKADAPYLKELEKIPADGRVKKYFQLKKQYAAQPSFFIDVARLFLAQGEKKMAIQVLSNVAEMKLEDAELLRMIASQLLEAGEKELALETFRDVMKMRGEDPQSYRDLALAFNESGKYNEAVELLYKVITQSWDGRFGEVKAVAINEMNAVISAHKDAVNTTALDKRLVHAMPVDVRIVIGWSSDNSDIDLWVTDPAKEKCSYEHTDTQIGGKISRDVTQGFGPEEFLLKKAINGKYKIEVNLYGDSRQTLGGPISIKADLFTDFGKPTQKKETINFRVTTNKEVVELGSLKFGS